MQISASRYLMWPSSANQKPGSAPQQTAKRAQAADTFRFSASKSDKTSGPEPCSIVGKGQHAIYAQRGGKLFILAYDEDDEMRPQAPYMAQSPHHYDSRWRGHYAFQIRGNKPNGDTTSPYNESSYMNYPGDYDLSQNLIIIGEKKYGLSSKARADLQAAQTHAQTVRMGMIDQYMLDEGEQRDLDRRIADADRELEQVINKIKRSAR